MDTPCSRRLKTDHPLYRVDRGHHAKEVTSCGFSLSLGHPGVVQAIVGALCRSGDGMRLRDIAHSESMSFAQCFLLGNGLG